MSSRQPARTARRARATIVVLLGVGLALAGARGYESSPSSSSIVASHTDPPRTESHTSLAEPGPTSSSTTASTVTALENPERGSTTSTLDSPSTAGSSPGELGAVQADRRNARGEAQRGAFSEADGVVPDGTTVFDDELPGIAKLDPVLLDAVRRAATNAASDGVNFVVNSGWRSAAFQDQMHREAVASYGSEAEASKWVATAGTSAHVTGDAVDIGPSAARTWLSAHGAEYGLCQVYSNEPWHFELRPEAIDGGCPAMYADATHDPRMQQ